MNGIIIKSGKKYKFLPETKYTVNRNTPVGEPADFYEIRPWGGRKPIYPILSIYKNEISAPNQFSKFDYDKKTWVSQYPQELVDFLKTIGI